MSIPRLLAVTGIFILCLLIPFRAGAADEYIQARAAIQISSAISDGRLTLSEIVKTAKQGGIKVIIVTDRDLMLWQYGLWPLRRIIKQTKKQNSVFTYGIKRYLKEIADLQKLNPDVIMIPAVESAPFYCWEGSPFSNNLCLKDWHKHILTIGLTQPQDYENLPVIGNAGALRLPIRLKNILQLWPVLLIIAGIPLLLKKKYDYKDAFGSSLGPFSRRWQATGILIILTGTLLLANNFPFAEYAFDQYRAGAGILPYQKYIDYVSARGGLTFWAHPDVENIEKIGAIKIETPEHSKDLLITRDYTGFAVFYEGYAKTGVPEGLWDQVLVRYCRGERKHPIWAIGALAFDKEGELSECLKELQTVLLVPRLEEAECLNALKKGRMYVLRGRRTPDFSMDTFSAQDSQGPAEVNMGGYLECTGLARIILRGHFLNGQNQLCKIKLIRDGKIHKLFDAETPYDIIYTDEDAQIGTHYYRIEAESEGLILISNPIFVHKK